MKLRYRGVTYDYQPAAIETQEGTIEGKYRGAGLKIRTSRVKLPALQRALDLIYRGVHYTIGGTEPAAETRTLQEPVTLFYRGLQYKIGETAPEVETQPVAIADQARLLVIQRRLKEEQRGQKVLERFEQAAGLPEDVWAGYDRHEAAMS